MPRSISPVLPAIQAELKPGETLLWNGKPQGGLRFRVADALAIPFSLMWGGFAFFWEATVIGTGAPFFFKLWGIPFVLVGIYMIFGRFIVDAKTREGTSYAVTDERVIIVSDFLGRKVRSLNLRNLPELMLQEKPDGSGTVTLGAATPFNVWGTSAWPGTSSPGSRQANAPALEMIEDVRRVYNTIQQAQQQAQQQAR